MKIEITYPIIEKRKLQRAKWLKIIRWPMLLAAVICAAVNIGVGGKAWSFVVLMSLYMLWTLVLSPDLVEYNRLSQFIKFVTNLCILLTLIDIFLTHGWATIAVPVLCCCGLTVSGVLLFTDFDRQKQNMFPLLLLMITTLLASIAGLCVCRGESRIAFGIMGLITLVLASLSVITLGGDFIRELRCRFHVK